MHPKEFHIVRPDDVDSVGDARSIGQRELDAEMPTHTNMQEAARIHDSMHLNAEQQVVYDDVVAALHGK